MVCVVGVWVWVSSGGDVVGVGADAVHRDGRHWRGPCWSVGVLGNGSVLIFLDGGGLVGPNTLLPQPQLTEDTWITTEVTLPPTRATPPAIPVLQSTDIIIMTRHTPSPYSLWSHYPYPLFLWMTHPLFLWMIHIPRPCERYPPIHPPPTPEPKQTNNEQNYQLNSQIILM